MSNSLLGLLSLIVGFGLLFAIVYFGFVKPFKENMEKSGETWKDLIEASEREYQVQKSKPFFSGGALIIFVMLFTYWWIDMEFSTIPLLILYMIAGYFRFRRY